MCTLLFKSIKFLAAALFRISNWNRLGSVARQVLEKVNIHTFTLQNPNISRSLLKNTECKRNHECSHCTGNRWLQGLLPLIGRDISQSNDSVTQYRVYLHPRGSWCYNSLFHNPGKMLRQYRFYISYKLSNLTRTAYHNWDDEYPCK